MAHFYGMIQGQRGMASRLGNKKSGLWAKVNGWDAGITVEAHAGDVDAFDVYMTSGSNGGNWTKHLGRVVLRDGLPAWEPAESEG